MKKENRKKGNLEFKRDNVERRTLLKIEMDQQSHEIIKESLDKGTFRKQQGILKIKKV